MNLRWLQENLPWQGTYTEAFEHGPAHNHFNHAVLHLTKAVGKLAAAVEPLDHRGGLLDEDVADEIVPDALADIVICAVRLARVIPGRKIDLAEAVLKRLHKKNSLPETWGNEAAVHGPLLTNIVSIVVGRKDGKEIVLWRERTNSDRESYVWALYERDSGTNTMLWEQEESDIDEVVQELDRRGLFNPFRQTWVED